MKKLESGVTRLCYLILLLLFLFTLGSVFIRSNQFLVCISAVLIGILLTYITYKSKRIETFFDQNYKYILFAFLAVVGIVQLSNINELRFTPSFDLDAIYGGAIQWIRTGSFVDYYDYYDYFPNNLGGLFFLYILFKAGSFFSSDFFLIAACGNEILLLLTYLFISLSAKKMWGSCFGVTALLMAGGMMPLLFMTDAFYTDSLSILFPVLLFYLSLKMEESNGKMTWLLYIISGIVAAIGGLIKSTVLIMVIALVISFLIRKEWKKAGLYFVCVSAICMVFISGFHRYIYSEHLDAELAAVKNTPYSHWIMMGLKDEGAYNPADYEFTRSFADPAVRDRAIKDEIINRISQKGVLGMIELYSVKLYRCFGDGTLALSDFLDDTPQNESLLHQFILYNGKQYGLYHSLCNGAFYAVLLLATACPLISITNGNTGRKMRGGPAMAMAVALGGLIIFLMNWETSPRYITNYVPIILLLAVGGSKGVTEWMKEKEFDLEISGIIGNRSKEIKIFVSAVCFRMIIYIFSVCIMAIMGEFHDGITFSDFLEAWKRWDSAHYINIAENGYAGAIENGEHIFLVFYPLYPWIMRIVSLFGRDIRLCGILISVISYAVGSVFFYKITEMEFGEKAAENAVILISIFPFAFFFGSIATESLFFALAAIFFYYLRKHEWNKVALFGFFACLTKVQGLLLAFSVLIELFYYEKGILLVKNKKWKDFLKKVIYPGCVCALMLGGFMIYLGINYVVEGDAFRFMYYQKNHWGNALCPAWETVKYIRDYAIGGWYTSTGMSLWVPELLLFIGYLAAIIYGICKKIRPMYLIYLILFFLLTYSSTWLISAGRYTLSALPVFMLAGKVTEKHEKIKIPVMVFSSMLLMIYMIGYYSWKQIM